LILSQLLKRISIVKDKKRDSYQDCVTAPLDREHNDNMGYDMDGLDADIGAADTPFGEILTAVPKVCYRTLFIGLGTNLLCSVAIGALFFSSEAFFGLSVQAPSNT
jgi:hypothetical protein